LLLTLVPHARILSFPLMIVPFKTSGTKPPLFLVHGSDGSVEPFIALSRCFDDDQPIYGIAQAPLGERSAVLSLEDMAANYLCEIQNLRFQGSCGLLGYSFGGLIAFEMASQLRRAGRPVAFLGMLDTWLPIYLSRATSFEHPRDKLVRKMSNIQLHLRSVLFGPQRIRWFRETVVSKFLVRLYASRVRRGLAIPEWVRNHNDLNIFVGSKYQPVDYSGPIILMCAKDENRDKRWDRDLGWRQVAKGGLEIRQLPGKHRNLVSDNPSMIADIVAEYLHAANNPSY
jgi:thioesterase domain-containing protein